MIRFSVRLRLVCVIFATMTALALGVSQAWAVAPSPAWRIETSALPTNFSSSDNIGCESNLLAERSSLCDYYQVTVRNTGAVSSSGAVSFADMLPAGLTARRVYLRWPAIAKLLGEAEGNDVFPTLEAFGLCSIATLTCSEVPFPIAPDEEVRMLVYVTVTGASGSLTDSANISGGGAGEASTSITNQAGTSPPPFGFSSFGFVGYGRDGVRDTQAGDHPYELTTTIGLNASMRMAPEGNVQAASVEDVRDVVTDLPVGFVGSALAAPQCSFTQLTSRISHGEGGCPTDSIVGHIETLPESGNGINAPIYNMTPETGVPAEFAYLDLIGGTHVFYVHVVPTAKGYVLQALNPDVPQIPLTGIVVLFYGDPAERDGTGNASSPFFTNPTDCAGEEPTATIYMDSWQHPAKFNPDGTPKDLGEAAWASMQSRSPAVTGCNGLQFPAEIKAQPTTREADKPSGMNFEIKVQQSETMGAPGTPTLKKAVVTLPEGFTVDPAAGDGLAACSVAQIGWVGPSRLNFNAAEPECPPASKIGSLTLESPLLARQLEGEMFLAAQNENPFDSTLAAYVVVHDPVTGVLIKIAGEFLADPHTGRLTAVFDENPNLPFSDLQLHFFGGPRAELATPEHCGSFAVETELTPWSAPDSGPAATPFEDFPIDEACPAENAFSPAFSAGSLNLQAGAYTPFVASFSRTDTDQELAGLTVKLPPGLSAIVTNVPECSQAQLEEAEAGTGGCPADTQVGTVRAGVGPGPDPFFATGKAYWTGPYNGGAFGLAVVVPAIAGPFNFGTVVVRQSIRIDPVTAQVTDVSDPFPTIIDGIPLRMRRVDVELNRPGFTFNPTDCEKLAFAGTVSGSPLGAPRTLNAHTVGYATQAGATSSFTTPFQVTNCATLAFKPSFKVSTSGRTSRKYGASLSVKLSYPKAPFGSQANIKSVHVELPRALPSRLSTLNHACAASVFKQNPAECPSQSKVGFARAVTPILPVPLEGPAYFVSHGGEEFPDLIVVLQGYGVTVDLVGSTFIKNGTTSSTFKTVPDVPVGSFELTLPEGPFSALAANRDLCQAGLVMPTTFDAQNGAVFKQSTQVAVSGCPYRLAVLGHRVRGRTLTLSVSVPAAGRLVASGNGLSSAAKSAHGRQTLVLTLHERGAGRLRTKVALRFTSGTSKKHRVLHKTLTVAFG